ncbi:MAG: ABC transporter substrate-binding protein [Candidatus Methanospirare jalkutatii]|nr:MAG: ABC transporter substrate-binding protein [Candidatus Methanospirare jalkutatii]
MRAIFPLLLLLFSVLLLFPVASAEFSAWNSITGNASKNISVDISIGEGKEVEFGISSDTVCTWSWFLNGELKEESEGKSSNFSHYFGEYGRYNISVVGSCGANTTQFRWNLTVYLVVGDENAVREFGGLENYTLRIADKPRRIVSLAPSCTEILFAVGAGEGVVGVTEYCNYPPEVEELKKEGKIGVIGGFSTPSFEKIVALEPDLIVSAYGNPEDVIKRLVEAGYKVYGTHARHIDDIYKYIEVIGEITGNRDNASSLVKSMKSRIERVKEDVLCEKEGNKPRVFQTCGEFWTAGEGTFPDEIIEIAGGDNIADYKEGYFQISAEKIIELNPQVIICNEMGDMCPDYDRIMSDERFRSVDAVREGRVYKIDADIVSRPGPRIVDAIEIVHEYLKGVCVNRTEEKKEEVSTAGFELFVGVFAISFIFILRRMRRRCDKK